MKKTVLRVIALWVSSMAMCPHILLAETPPFPVLDGNTHQGVASCAGSMCHGAVRPHKNTHIQHDEYIIWDRKDIHSRAYNKLFNDDFKAITRKLGLKAPHEEPVCLACHASDVPVELRGKKFQMSDGIGCETCHGGSEKWLKRHTSSKTTHRQNIENGLYPTDDIVARARLCLSCHYGNEQQFVTHEIMGAGHPRISFELDTFTELQPKHFTQDEDYAERKTPVGNVKAWAVGQAVTVQSMLEMMASEQFRTHKLYPELSLFDCHSCHHPMSDKRWQPRKGISLPPGSIPLNDAALLMLRHVITVIDSAEGWRFKLATQKLHELSAGGREAFEQQVETMQKTVDAYLPRIVAHTFSLADIRNITRSILREGIWEGFNDYVVAEQSVMALTLLAISWDSHEAFGDVMQQTVSREIDTLYTLVKNDEAYDFHRFRNALITLRETLFHPEENAD